MKFVLYLLLHGMKQYIAILQLKEFGVKMFENCLRKMSEIILLQVTVHKHFKEINDLNSEKELT